MATDCVLPELGENISVATVVEVFVKVGDVVETEQSVMQSMAEAEHPRIIIGQIAMRDPRFAEIRALAAALASQGRDYSSKFPRIVVEDS